MRRKRLGVVVASTAAAFLVGACMSASMGTGLTQLSADTYRLSRIDAVGRYPDVAALKAAVIEEADAFARGQGKTAVPISSHEETMRAGHLSTVEYKFRLAATGEPTPAPTAPTPAPVQRASGVAEPSDRGTAATAQPAVPAVAVPSAAATAPAPAVAGSAAQPATPGTTEARPDLYHELIMLDDLRQRGILTDAEFQALKTKLLAGK